MSLAKTLIQKEIDRNKRAIQARKEETIRLKKLRKEPEEKRMPTEDIDSFLATYEKHTDVSKIIIKELEADLKKL